MAWTLPVRLVRSFEYRLIKVIVLCNVDSNWTTEEFADYLREGGTAISEALMMEKYCHCALTFVCSHLLEIRKSTDIPAPFKAVQFGRVATVLCGVFSYLDDRLL